jgi:hypothetical protein
MLIKFLAFALPKVPGLADVAKDFWGQNNLGPMPPDLGAWDDVDARVNQARDTQNERGL